MDVQNFYEHYFRDDPSTQLGDEEGTFVERLAWFAPRVPRGAVLLDYGCGDGVMLAALAERGALLHPDSCGVDISQNAIRKAANRFPALRGLRAALDKPLPLAGGIFDCVVASDVIEHVFDTDGMLREIHRLLKPGGILLLSCPYHGPLKDLVLLIGNQMDNHYRDPYSDHIRYFSTKTLKRVLHNNHFVVRECGGVGRIPWIWTNSMVLAEKPAP